MQDLGSHVYSNNQDWETQDKRDQKYYALRDSLVEGLEGIDKHFYGAYYDARILELGRQDGLFRLRLEDYAMPEFVEIVAGLCGVAVPEIKSEVELTFHDVVYYTTLAAQPDGLIRFFRYDQPGDSDYLYRDWFVRQDGRLQWIAELSPCLPTRRGRGSLTVGPFLVIDCHSVSVDDRRESWLRLNVSPALADLWAEYWSAFRSPGSGAYLAPTAFTEFCRTRGLAPEILFPNS